MNDDKNKGQRLEGSGEQNPTLNNPGAKVADYGNSTGGSAVEDASQQQGSNPQRGNTGKEEDHNDTMGNP